MPPLSDVAMGIGIGALAGAAHLLVLHRAVEGLAGRDAETARRRLARGYLLRLVAFLPLLGWAAVSGLGACLGLVAGLLLGRALTYGALARVEWSGTGRRDRQEP